MTFSHAGGEGVNLSNHCIMLFILHEAPALLDLEVTSHAYADVGVGIVARCCLRCLYSLSCINIFMYQ